MTKLYHNGQLEGWQLPGEQDKGASRVDVPSSPADLSAWLNFRRVGPTGAAAEQDRIDTQLSGERDETRFWELGPPTKEPPRYAPEFLGDAAARVDFVPISRSAAIAASYGGCPKCHRTWTAQVLAGIATAEIDDLKMIADAIKNHVAELNEQLDQAGEAN